jgi:ribosomal protein L16 Arg81 hydroxylase
VGDPARELELEDLLSPVSPEEFFETYWERRPLHVGGDRDRLAGLFDLDSFYRAVTEVRLPDQVPVPYLKAGYRDGRGDHREMFPRPEQIPGLFRAGMTIQAELLDRVDERLHGLMDRLRRRLGIAAPMDVGAFLSPDGSGYGLHFDATGMWTLQIEGRKRWWYSPEPEVEFPGQNHVAGAAERERVEGRGLAEVLLEPGDLFYLPPGVWHRVRAEGQSLHVSITVRASSSLSLVDQLLRARLLDRPVWRRMPTALRGAAAGVDDRVRDLFARQLAELREAVAALTPEDLVRSWLDRVGGAQDARPVERSDVLALAQPVQMARRDGAVEILCHGRLVASLPVDAQGFAERLTEQTRFPAESALAWDPAYEWEEVGEVLRVLVELGVLEREAR